MKLTIKILLAGACLAFATQTASAQTFVRMVSGPAGGSWYPLGAIIMQTLGEGVKGISTSNAPGGGLSNVKDVNNREAEIGFSYAHSVYEGYMGKGKFDKAYKNVRHFATLYPAAFQVAVAKNSPIKSFSDMKGKNLSPGKAGWTGTAFAESILREYGLDFAKIKQQGGTVHYVDYATSVNLMKDGHIDVFMAVTSFPQSSFISLNFTPGIRFIGIEKNHLEKILKDNPGYITQLLPKGTYEGMDADVPGLGAVNELVINKDMPDDMVYNMAKVFWASHAKFLAVKKEWANVLLKNALNGAAIPVHPGAKRYYDEQGVK